MLPDPLRLGAPSRPPPPRRSGASRRPFVPTPAPGPYRLPLPVLDRLQRDLGSFRNAAAAFDLALFLARHHSMPRRLNRPFPCDRRALVGHRNLDLSESRIRGALETLEKVGFVVRDLVSGSAYHRTKHGLRRKAVLWRFGPEYAPAFLAANARVKAARGAPPARRPIIPPPPLKQPPAVIPAKPTGLPALLCRSPIGHIRSYRTAMSLGPMFSPPPAWPPPAPSTAPDAGLAAALDRICAARARSIAPRCNATPEVAP